MKNLATGALCAGILTAGAAELYGEGALGVRDAVMKGIADAHKTEAQAPAKERAKVDKMSLPLKAKTGKKKVSNPFGDKGQEYLLVGYSMFDFTLPEEEQNVFGAGGRLCSYPVYISVDEKKSTFSIYNLVNLSSDIEQLPVEGSYDSKTGTMTITTNPYFESADETGVLCKNGDDYIILQAGSPVGAGYWQDSEQLVINSSESGDVLTPESGYAAFGFRYDDYWEEFNQSALYDIMYNVHLYKVSEGVNILPSTYTLDAGECFEGATREMRFTVINTGSEESDFVVKTTGEGFTCNTKSGMLGALDSHEVIVTFKPDKTGEFNGKITIQSEGDDIEVSLHGVCEKFPDFGRIVSGGASMMTFSTSDDYPWRISDDIIDGPVAVSSNKGVDNSESSLTIEVEIPEGDKGVLNWKGFFDPFYGTRDEFYITDNDKEVYITPIKHKIGEISGGINLLAGKHEIVFTYHKELSVYPDGVEFGSDRTYLSDLNLVLDSYKEQAASLTNDNVDFNRFFLVMDKVEHNVDGVSVRNEGYNTLKINGIKPQGVFWGVAEKTELAPEELSAIKIGFTAMAPGEYEDDLIISTSAGDLKVHCKVLVEQSPDYTPIVSNGDFIFVPDNDYPFVVEDGVAYNGTAEVTDNEETLSVLSAVFNVPEGKFGKLTWDGSVDTQRNAYSADYGVIMVDNDSYGLHFYHGKDDAGTYSVEPNEVYFAPGTHVISWGYVQNGDKTYYGKDRIMVSNLNLQYLNNLPKFEVWHKTPIDMGEVFTGSLNIREIEVANFVKDELAFLSGDASNDFKLLVDEEMNSQIPKYGKGTVEVEFIPSKPGDVNYDLTLVTSGGNVSIPVVGKGRDSDNCTFIEDFENGIGEWTVVDANEDKYYWQPDVMGTYSRTGLGSVMIGTVFSDYTDDYLVSPEFLVPDEETVLEYWRRYTKEDRNEYDVLIGEGDDYTTYKKVYTDESHSQFEFEKITVKLSEFAGKKVRLAFHNRTPENMNSVLIIDDLSVSSPKYSGIIAIVGEVKNVEYYDLRGVRYATRPAGVYIEKVTLSDGTTKFVKRINNSNK